VLTRIMRFGMHVYAHLWLEAVISYQFVLLDRIFSCQWAIITRTTLVLHDLLTLSILLMVSLGSNVKISWTLPSFCCGVCIYLLSL